MDSLAAAIAAAHDKARARWPDVAVDLATFTDEIHRRYGADVTVAQLQAYYTDDLYLAIACLAGDRTAIDHLERDYLTVVNSAARRTRATEDQINEVRAQMRHNLFTADEKRGAALTQYSGRTELRGYLKAIAANALFRLVNRGRKDQPIEPLLEQLYVSHAPELEMLRAKYGEAVSEALRAAVEGLEDRPRSLLRFSHVNGWSIDQIGKYYAKDRSTAARWLNAARDTLGDNIRKEVAQRCAISVSEVDSLVRNVQSQIDVSLLRIL